MKTCLILIISSTLAFVLLGCTRVIDTTIPLTRNFEENSELITIGNIDFLIRDSQLDKKLGDYESVNADLSWKKGTQIYRKKTNHSDWGNLLSSSPVSWNIVVINKLHEQTYSFDLAKDSSVKNRTQCKITSEVKTTIDERYDDSFSDGQHTILYTNLECSITIEDELWELKNLTNAFKASNLTLNNKERNIRILLTNQKIDYAEVDEKIEQRLSPSTLGLKSGALILDHHQQIAAVSFVGDPKTWLLKDLTPNLKEVLLSATYSLVIFNRLEPKWR